MGDLASVATAAIAAIPPTLAVVFAYRRSRAELRRSVNGASTKLDQIHVLVNGRLEQALRALAEINRETHPDPTTADEQT